MECKQTGENLSAYLDGELEPEEEKVLKSHLEGCEPCRTELERLRSTVRLVRSLPRAQAPAALKQRLMAAAGARRPGYRLPFAMTALTAAALVLVSIVAAYMLIPHEPITPDATTAKTELARPDAGRTSAPLAKAAAREAVPHADKKGGRWAEKAEEMREFEEAKGETQFRFKTLARRREKWGKEAEEVPPAPPGQLAPEPYQDTLAKLERKLEKHAEFDAAKTEIRDEPAQAQAEPRPRKARGKRAPEPAAEYLFETPNVARTAALVRKLIARYAVVRKPDEAPSTGADRVQGKEMVGGESVVLQAEVDSRDYPALIARLDALRAQTALEDMDLSKAATGRPADAAEQEAAEPPAEAEPRKERVAKAPAGRAVRRRAPVPENAMAQQRKHKKAGKKKEKEERREQEKLAQQAEQAPVPRPHEEQGEAKAAPVRRIALCIKIRRRDVSATIEALRAQEAAAKKLLPEEASPKGK